MSVAGMVEVGRSMSRFLKYMGLTGGYRCSRESVQRVVRGLDAAMLEHVVDVVSSSYSESYMD